MICLEWFVWRMKSMYMMIQASLKPHVYWRTERKERLRSPPPKLPPSFPSQYFLPDQSLSHAVSFAVSQFRLFPKMAVLPSGWWYIVLVIIVVMMCFLWWFIIGSVVSLVLLWGSLVFRCWSFVWYSCDISWDCPVGFRLMYIRW